jgi:hypothetical protein
MLSKVLNIALTAPCSSVCLIARGLVASATRIPHTVRSRRISASAVGRNPWPLTPESAHRANGAALAGAAIPAAWQYSHTRAPARRDLSMKQAGIFLRRTTAAGSGVRHRLMIAPNVSRKSFGHKHAARATFLTAGAARCGPRHVRFRGRSGRPNTRSK